MLSSNEILSKGKEAELLACEYLQHKNLKLIKKNYYCKLGEIDLIMRDAETLVFVEVRYRSSTIFGSALDSINKKKQEKLIRTAEHYLQSLKYTHNKPKRFDVIAFQQDKSKLDINWIQNAFML